MGPRKSLRLKVNQIQIELNLEDEKLTGGPLHEHGNDFHVYLTLLRYR